MKAAVIHEFGPADVLRYEEVPTPEPGPGEVLIRLHAVGVNHMDLDVREGKSGYAFRMPHIMGSEGAGEIVAVGPDVAEFIVGDRVIPAVALSSGTCRHRICNCSKGFDNLCLDFSKLGVDRWGTYAEYVKVSTPNLVRIPANLSYTAAAASRTAFSTAWELVIEQGSVRAGEDVLVNAAGGGVGSAAVQVAARAGARVIASAGSDDKLARARELGAHDVINYRTKDLAAEALRLTHGRGVDLVIELVGGRILQQSLVAAALGGRIATGGAHAGEKVEIDIVQFFRKQLTMTSTHSFRKSTTSRILELIADGSFAPLGGRTFALREASLAHGVLASRDFFGKLLLIP